MNMTSTRDFPSIKTHVRAVSDGQAASTAPAAGSPKIQAEGATARYGQRVAVDNVSMPFYKNLVTAIIGPSGCGKSTLLRTLNRMNDAIPGFQCSLREIFE